MPPGPHRLTVGLRPLDIAGWLDLGGDLDAQLRERARLLEDATLRAACLAGDADTVEAEREVLAAVVEHVLARDPLRYVACEDAMPASVAGVSPTAVRRAAAGSVRAIRVEPAGLHVELAGEQPLATAARLAAEDFCLMRADGHGSYRLVAAVLCFPTRWRLAEKVGLPMREIHAPVPGYDAELGAASDRVLSTLRVERPLWRENWSLLDSPALHQPRALHQPVRLSVDVAAGEPPSTRLWLRSERQTLRRLPVSGDVLFTIRIRQARLDGALGTDADLAERLRVQLESMPVAMRDYKGITEHFDALRAALG